MAGRIEEFCTGCPSRTKHYLNLLTIQASALLTRLIFGIIGLITIWRVTNVYQDKLFYLLCLPVLLLVVEFVLTNKYTENGEWKWFCPSVFLCVAGVVPGIWLLQIDLYTNRKQYSREHDVECGNQVYNATAALTDNDRNPLVIALPTDEWPVIIEQCLFFVLIMGRWLLPKGDLTRDQLSQLLLVYIGIAADSLEFSLETLKIQRVLCNLPLIIIVLTIWTWSLTQFMLVLTSVSAPKREAVVKTARGRSFFGGCCENEIWALIITMCLQDAPYLITRLYLIFAYQEISPLIIFFTFKNGTLVILQFYRMAVVCAFKKEDGETPLANDGEGEAMAPTTPDKTAYIELGSIVEAETSLKSVNVDVEGETSLNSVDAESIEAV